MQQRSNGHYAECRPRRNIAANHSRQKAAYKGEKTVTSLDWFAAVFTFMASAALAFFGLLKPALVQNLGIPAIVFGCVGMWIAGSAMWEFAHRPKEKR